jgi:ketosteroid isomerase-like protein
MTDTTQASRSVVENWYRALAAGNMEGVVGALAEDLVAHVAGRTPVSGTHEGRDAFVQNAIAPMFAALNPETVRFAHRFEIFAADGERVVAMMEGDARTHDGALYDNSYCHLFTVRDGQIVELHEFLDTALLRDVIFGQPVEAS